MNPVYWNKKTIFPSKIICIGRNYSEHIEELNNQPASQAVIFMKPNSAISRDVLTVTNEVLHFEAELCFLIEDEKPVAVGFGLDLTKRNLQSQLKSQGLPWERAKAFNHSAVFSEFVSFNGNLDDLGIKLDINENTVQLGYCRQMLYKPDFLIQEILNDFSFENGDILMTGTPKGVGEVVRGDRYRGKVLYQENTLVEENWVVK